jgi:hypothetical protein
MPPDPDIFSTLLGPCSRSGMRNDLEPTDAARLAKIRPEMGSTRFRDTNWPPAHPLRHSRTAPVKVSGSRSLTRREIARALCGSLIGQAGGEWKAVSGAQYLWVPGVDATYAAALRTGATSQLAPEGMTYGHRNASVLDRNGISW